MAISTYDELKTAVKNWLEIDEGDRETIDAEIDEFILLAEDDFNRELRTSDMEYRATTSTEAGTAFYSYPDTDTLAITNIQLNTDPRVSLERYSKEQLDREYRTGTGQPQVFTINANQIELGPTPDAVYTMEVSFIKEIPGLSSLQTTNWLLTEQPSLYLAMVLKYAFEYFKDYPNSDRWGVRAERKLESLKEMDKKDKWSTGPLTMMAT
jgi:hypothetical protein